MGVARVILPTKNLAAGHLPKFCIRCGAAGKYSVEQEFRFRYLTTSDAHSSTEHYRVFQFKVPVCDRHKDNPAEVGWPLALLLLAPGFLLIAWDAFLAFGQGIHTGGSFWISGGFLVFCAIAALSIMQMFLPHLTFADGTRVDTRMVEMSGVSKEFADGCAPIVGTVADSGAYQKAQTWSKLYRYGRPALMAIMFIIFISTVQVSKFFRKDATTRRMLDSRSSVHSPLPTSRSPAAGHRPATSPDAATQTVSATPPTLQTLQTL